jgi:phage tail-like protein
MQLPSVQLDQWAEDHLSATLGTVLSTEEAPFVLADGMTLQLEIDGDAGSHAFDTLMFVDITQATLAEVVDALRPTVLSLNGEIYLTGTSFAIRTLTYGIGGNAKIVASAAAAPLGLAVGDHKGHDAPDDVLVANRNPQPSEVQIPLDAGIEFDFIRTSGALPDDDEFVVTVNGVVAFEGTQDGGDFQAGFSGDVFDFVPDDATIRFVVYRLAAWAAGQVVTVEVDVNDGENVFSWTFTAYDTIPPLLSSVAAVNKDQIRVMFNEPVSMVSSTIEGDALNPDSYYIERISRPATTPAVLSVERVSSTTVLLTTAFELTFGAAYMLVVTGIEDEFDNEFLPPDNVVEFTGWLPPFPAGRRFLLHDFVPAFTLAEDATDELRLFLGCLQDSTNLILHLADKWAEIIDPDFAPEPFLDAMLADLGNPFEFELTTVDAKRKLAKLLVRIYQLKGTARGMIDVVRFFLGIEISIEIFNGRGWRLGYDKLSGPTVAVPNPAIIGPSGRALYSFRVNTAVILTDTQREQITSIAVYMKGAQEHLVGVRDATVTPVPFAYLKLDFTKLGYSKLAGS